AVARARRRASAARADDDGASAGKTRNLAEDSAEVNRLPALLLLARKLLGLGARVEAHGVDDHVRLLYRATVVGVRAPVAVPINAVGEHHDGLATLHATQGAEGEVERVVEARALPRSRRAYRVGERGAVAREVAKLAHRVVEGDDLHAVALLQVVCEGDVGLLHLSHLLCRSARARVYQEDDVEGLGDGGEERDLLLRAVFGDAELLRLEVRHVAPAPVADDDGHGDEVRLDLDGLAVVVFNVVRFGRLRFRLGGLRGFRPRVGGLRLFVLLCLARRTPTARLREREGRKDKDECDGESRA